mmetsp:Transcript_1115/g.2213  ORF Transcript_1115/g.2213 Transcript_1115/m.2213 type:complete len:280 (+) Transcript_1115:224-1063(+)
MARRDLTGLILAEDGVGRPVVGHQFARAVRVQIARHVVSVLCHRLAHLIEGPGGDLVARAVDLPRDRRIHRALLVVARGASRGADVLGHIFPVGSVFPRAAEEVVLLVLWLVRVDDGEDLALHADLLVHVKPIQCVLGVQPASAKRDHAPVAEDAVVEGELHLPLGAARAGGRVRPVDLVGLAHLHALAVLPVIRFGVHLLILVVVVALEAEADALVRRQLAAVVRSDLIARLVAARAVAVGPIELAGRHVLRAQVPVNVHDTQALCRVVAHDWVHAEG